jgi:protein-L-isoaspartate(D-aspartate) O-methyltransferase
VWFIKFISNRIPVIASFLLLSCLSCEREVPLPKTANDDGPVTYQLTGADAANKSDPNQNDPNMPQWTHPRSDERMEERKQLVEILRRRYEMKDQRILQAMLDVPRHWFIPSNQQRAAYADRPLPIGYGQTISQPFIVAYMTQLLELTPESKVLEIGTGSGYQAAVLSELTPHVYSIEIVEPLGKRAMGVFNERGYDTIKAKIGDGYKGWPEYAPFDAVIVTCAPDHIPKPLIEQLKPGGCIVIPVGSRWGVQDLMLVTKDMDGKLKRQSKMPVRFVPLTRENK